MSEQKRYFMVEDFDLVEENLEVSKPIVIDNPFVQEEDNEKVADIRVTRQTAKYHCIDGFDIDLNLIDINHGFKFVELSLECSELNHKTGLLCLKSAIRKFDLRNEIKHGMNLFKLIEQQKELA